MLSYGSSGVGSVFHLMGELFNQTAGVSINHVPYRGVAPRPAGRRRRPHPDGLSLDLERAGPRRQRGHQDPRSAASPQRFARRPDIPSMSEAVPAFRAAVVLVLALFGPAGLPAPMVARLNGEINKTLAAADVKPSLIENGLSVIGGSPEDFRALIVDGLPSYGAIIRAAGIKPE